MSGFFKETSYQVNDVEVLDSSKQVVLEYGVESVIVDASSYNNSNFKKVLTDYAERLGLPSLDSINVIQGSEGIIDITSTVPMPGTTYTISISHDTKGIS